MIRQTSELVNFLLRSYLLIGMVFSVPAPKALAEAELPQITSHSETAFAVYQGDRFGLEIFVAGQIKAIKWIKSEVAVCESLRCEFDSASWGFGTHTLVAVLTNDSGSRSLTWRIKVLLPPADYKVGTTSPKIVEGDGQSFGVRSDDLLVVALKGKGFLEDAKVVRVVGGMSQRLAGNEKLMTKVGGVLRFGRPGTDEHVLAPRSSVSTELAESFKKILSLETGSLRSRNFSNSEPLWKVAVGGWLEVQADNLGDIVVRKIESESGDSVRVATLRGAARVTYRAKDLPDRVVNVPAGLETVFLSQGGDPVSGEINPVKVGSLVELTTPHWIPGSFEMQKEKTPVSPLFLRAEPSAEIGAAVIAATRHYETKDHALIVESFAASTEAAKKDPLASLLLGRSLLHLALHRSAAVYLKFAHELAPESGEAAWWLGRMAVANNKWAKAIYWLDLADSRGYADREGVAFYRGIAELNSGNKISARTWFTYALWYEQTPAIAAQSRKYLRELEEDRFFRFSFGVGGFYDSNLARAPKSGGFEYGLDLGVPQSTGLSSKIAVEISGFKSGPAEVTMGYAWDFRLPFGEVAVNFSRMSHELDVKVSVMLGETFAVSARPWLSSTLIGGTRAVDSAGSDVSLSMQNFYGAYLKWRSRKSLDPHPEKHDMLDPVTDQMTKPTDRSNFLSEYSIGGRPFASEFHDIELDFAYETIEWLADLDGDTKRTRIGIDAVYIWKPILRTNLSLGLAYSSIGYSEGRSDSLSILTADWKWFYTPAIYQLINITYESQASNREYRIYKRSAAEFSFNVEI